MIRIVLFLISVLVVAWGFAWVADRPGQIAITWMGYRVETSVIVAAFAVVERRGPQISAKNARPRRLYKPPADQPPLRRTEMEFPNNHRFTRKSCDFFHSVRPQLVVVHVDAVYIKGT